MPSSRAVLADLQKFSLDPKKPWSSLGKDGRLKSDNEIANENLNKHTKENLVLKEEKVEHKVDVKPPEQIAEPVVEELQVQHEVLEDVTELVSLEAEEVAPDLLTEVNPVEASDDLDSLRFKKKKK